MTGGDATVQMPATDDGQVAEDDRLAGLSDAPDEIGVAEDGLDDLALALAPGDRPEEDADTPRARRRAARQVQREGGGGRRALGRAARRARQTRNDSPAARRAELVAAAAAIAAAAPAEEAGSDAVPAPRRARVLIGRVVAFATVLMLPAAVWALVVNREPVAPVPVADASYVSAQLIASDQRVRTELSRLGDLGTARALARTRDTITMTRSLALEAGDNEGAATGRLQRALALERDWLDAVGSTLSNPRSPLRTQLLARDEAARGALAALPATAGRRTGGARHLVAYARSRVRAGRDGGGRKRSRR